ncbi:unnamed protein product [Brassicogethes aeneus]|uniref:Major facilitator superfamily associated domain-containing protein n=1 Tax=Brassicogethes aeneus TaxID=1431903 RepID=A0A9P0BA37_BRAAE|nr:unnamed protein product [Brassicogethes aeneus]
MKYFNENLITLKCVLFLFFGALGGLLPFLPLHMDVVGLSKDESVIVSVVAPLIALLGPLVAAPLADRLASGGGGNQRSKTGRYLRVMLSLCFILATIFYWLLMLIPPIIRSPPNVTFMCDQQGGFVLQDRCGAERTCYNWGSSKGSVLVKNCIFSCNATTNYSGEVTTAYPDETDTFYESDYEDQLNNDDNSGNEVNPDTLDLSDYSSNRNFTGIVPLPHMCYENDKGESICEVYTEYSQPIDFKIGLTPNLDNATESDFCKYPFADKFHCRITDDVVDNLTNHHTEECHPIVVCQIHDPYNNSHSLLKRSQCGYDNISFWLYLFIRSVADIFPAAAVALLGAAVVIATRETSTGRGDVGKQFAAAALGFGIFAVIIGGAGDGKFLNAMICFTVLMLLAVLILLFDNKMPLSPPEWWWHTRCGLLALPMSSVRKYGLEIISLGVVLFLLGIFWNSIDTFLPWHVVKIPDGEPLLIGLTIAVAAIPAIVYFVYAEKIVDYCGHSNILIYCFVNYIIHHIGLIVTENAKVLLIFEFLEIFSLHLMYVTAVLYFRHLVPRKFTACGQALPVITHFCLGRCIGALLGGLAYSEYPDRDNFNSVHKWFTVAACITAIIYFLAYHFYLKPQCAAAAQVPPDPAPSVVQNMNGNGTYTPLRVYHNGKAKKGHFRY